MASEKRGVFTGGYEYDYVDENLPQDYECPICMLVLRNPQMVSCCGRKFCESCISVIKTANKPCPFCKEPFECMAEKQLNRRILDLKVKCFLRKKGCEWVGEIRDIDKHLNNSCLFTESPCPLGCGETIMRQDMEQHQLDECTKRPAESKLFRLAQKLEARLQLMERKCEEQDAKIKEMDAEICKLKETNEQQATEMQSLNQLIKKVNDGHQTDLQQTLRVIESELIRRCFCFSVSLSISTSGDSSSDNTHWVSPSFLSHQNGYVLQLVAHVKRNQSMMKTLRNLFHSGSRPDKYPVYVSLGVLHRQASAGRLDWPVYISVDILVLSNTDAEANAKLVTVSCYETMPTAQSATGGAEAPEEDDEEEDNIIIGHALHSFNCRLIILKIEHGPEPPIDFAHDY